MHIDEKLDFLRKYADQSQEINHNNIANNSDFLKSCLYQISSLNLAHLSSPRQHPPTIEDNNYITLPKIKHRNNSEKQQTAKSLLTQGKLLLNSFSKNNQHSKINLSKNTLHPIPFLSKTLKQNKSSKSKPKPLVRKARKGLSKQQRYFQIKAVVIDKETVNQLGLYESGNLFQTKNIQQNAKSLAIIAQKPQFSPIKLANKHDLFLTNIMPDAADFCVEHFIDQEMERDRSSSTNNLKYDSQEYSKQQHILDSSINNTNILIPTSTIQQTFLYLTFKNYELVQNQSYKIFKIRHLENWGAIKMNIFMITKCLQIHKINQILIKQHNLIFWQGRKTTESKIKQLLGISTMVRSTEKISRTVLAFRDKLKVSLMKRAIQRRESLAKWVILRLKTLINLNKIKKQKINRALKLHNQLKQNPKWEVQIHIPSFSVECFKRNTTQYMESFQAHYHTLWDSSPFPLVLIMPTLNENILKLLQSRIKVTRSVTIITPEIHQLFPLNLSLAAQVLFSHETLTKIERAVAGRKAVIIGGNYEDPIYELKISDYLNAPLFCSLTISNDAEQQKRLFLQTGLKIMEYCVIKPKTSLDDLLQQFSALLLKKIGDKSWVFKIKGEFRGRGIATFHFNTAKYINSQNSVDKNRNLLIDILKSTLRLKLKVNFQNSLYMVEDFLQSFRDTGGIIQEFIETSATYQLCFVKHQETQLISLFRVYGINFANKVWLSAQITPEISIFIENFIQLIQNGDYLGHLSITIVKTIKGDFVGVDVKLGKTSASSATPFLSMLQETKLQKNGQAINLAALPTLRQDPLTQKIHQASTLQSRFLLIPTLPFTDIQETTKSKFIEDVMIQCWSDRRLQLGQEGRLFLSMGLDFSGIITGRDMKRLKKLGIQLVRELTERTSSLKQYRGKQVVRDVFQYGDVIRAISMIRNED